MKEITTIFDPDQVDLQISKIPKSKSKVPFYLTLVTVNKIKDTATGLTVNAAVQFKKMSHSAHWLFWNLIDDINILNNIAVFRAKNNLEAKKVSKAYRQLYILGLVHRVKRQYYMINPNSVLPFHDNYFEVCAAWSDLKEGELSNDRE